MKPSSLFDLVNSPADRLSCRWVLATASRCGYECQSLWYGFFFFLLLHLTLVMKSGLLCFSHYLFIKDMTGKWELPWRRLHKVSELYAELHCLLFCQERGAEWGAGGVFSFFSLLSSQPLPRTFCLSLFPLCLKQWPANRPVRCGHFKIFKMKYFISFEKKEKTIAEAATLRGKVKKKKKSLTGFK